MHTDKIALSPDAGDRNDQVVGHQYQLELRRQFRGGRQFQLGTRRAYIANDAVDDRLVFIEDNLPVFQSPLSPVSSALGVLGHQNIAPNRARSRSNQ